VNPTPHPQVNELIEYLLSNMQAILSEKLVGVYLHGSLVNGDFDIQVSDVDMLAALTEELTEVNFNALQQMYADTALEFPKWAGRIETAYLSLNALKTFKTLESKIGNISPGEPFHIIDAGKDWLPNWYMVQQKGKTLFGPPPGTLIDPISKEEFVATIRERHLPYWRDYTNIEFDYRGSQAYVILTMCRAMYTCKHGEQVSKIKAAEWAEQAHPEWAALIRQAVQWRKSSHENQDSIDHASTLAETRRFVAFAIETALSEPT
jgi:hypothetical protein